MSAKTTTKTAIISGGCSGMGLALAQHLLSQPISGETWRVVLLDINASAYDAVRSTLKGPESHLFISTDVSSWESQLSAFKDAYKWSGGRLDYFAANAGIGDQEWFTQPTPNLDDDPICPNLACVNVDLIAVLYGLKLYTHYVRKTHRDLFNSSIQTAQSAGFHPKMTITASSVGMYPFALGPQYCASKHGCLGLTRSAAPMQMKYEGIAINCLMPGFVRTGIIPPPIKDMWPPEHDTPMATVVRAHRELLDVHGRVEQDGKSDGENGVVKNGQSVELSRDLLWYRKPVEPRDESMAWVIPQLDEEGIFGRALEQMGVTAKGQGDFGWFGRIQKVMEARIGLKAA